MSQNKPIKTAIPEPEVVPQAERRQFSAKYKLRILEEADNCNGAGELGALLRREGLYEGSFLAFFPMDSCACSLVALGI